VGIVLVFPLLVMAGAAFVFLGIAAFTQEAAITAALILGGAFLATLLVVLVFGLRLAGRVRTLADAAARISTGTSRPRSKQDPATNSAFWPRRWRTCGKTCVCRRSG